MEKEELNEEGLNEIEPLKLKIDAHVVKQLGAELISGPEIALIELVKNAFDADASYCEINIQTDYEEEINGKKHFGKITIKDNGHGMDRDVINRSWLTISHSDKRNAKATGKKTVKYTRSYTGDKGLGRLGSMQLGDVCEIKTHDKPNSEGLRVSFCWSDFKQGQTLDSVKIIEENLSKKKKAGTELNVIGLNNFAFWTEEKNLTKIKYKLSSMVSPFGHFKNFEVLLKIEGVAVELETFNSKVHDLCSSQFDFDIVGNLLILTGKLKLQSFSSPNEEERFQTYVVSDEGKKLARYLSSKANLAEYEQSTIEDSSYYLSFRKEIDIRDLSATKKKRLKVKNFTLKNFTHPGDFDGKIFQFIFRKNNLDLKDISFNETKTIVQELTGGVAAYRDGFKIGSNKSDWLGFSEDMTSGGGAYSLRPVNIAGYINLTCDNNPLLKEKSDRESFIENDAYEGFYIICQEIISSINNYLNKSRRATLEYIKLCGDEDLGKPKGYSAKHAIDELSTITTSAKKMHSKVQKESDKAKSLFINSKKQLDDVIKENEDSMLRDTKLTKVISDIKQKINDLEEQLSEYSSGYLNFTKDLGDHIRSTERIQEDIDNYKNQIINFYDHVAIGLSAQALAHEANSQLVNISLHLNSAFSRVKELGIKDSVLTKSLLAIRSDSQVMSKSVSSLNPLVRSQRDILEKLNLYEQIENYFDLRVDYFKQKGIEIKFSGKQSSSVFKFNRGKLFQVIDNIVRNSEHWLEVFATHNPNEELVINIESSGSDFVIWDTGRGIRPPLEEVLFDMFSSDKESGQGLGLFIAQNLLTERGCTITLLQDRNKFDRRYKFRVDLIEAMD